MTTKWRLMNEGDRADICAIAAICHPNFPEDEAVLVQKQIFSPQSCYVLEENNKPSGYILAHPWQIGNIPSLNQLLVELPKDANALYIHDIALLPHVRQGGIGSCGLKILYAQAKSLGFDTIALVAVNHSSSFWSRQGFIMQKVDLPLQQKLLTYSDDAVYMLKSL